MIADDVIRAALARCASEGRIGRGAIAAVRAACQVGCDDRGRADPALRRLLPRVERALRPRMTNGGALAFQTMLAEMGVRQTAPLMMPEIGTPYWLSESHPLSTFCSSPTLPRAADVIVIGAGLTGASTAYHLAPHASRGLRVVVIEAGDPGTQASGRNGGNFELMPENFLGEYEGLVRERAKWLFRTRTGLTGDDLARAAEHQARVIFRFCMHNAKRLVTIVEREKIPCDLSRAGWLRIADTKSEQAALEDDVRLATELGGRMELWSAARIRKSLEIPARFAGRMARFSGNYHPFKLVNALLALAIERGVRLYSRTRVVRVRRSRHGLPVLETTSGTIEARRVVFATNAFTASLLPELAQIRYYQSQVLTLEHVPDTLRGMTVTEKKGDLYYNFPAARRYVDTNGTRRGMLLVGGGLDRPGRDPVRLRRSGSVLELVKQQVDERFPSTAGQPPSRLWTGPMAFSSDRVPAIGFLHAKGRPSGLIVAAGFNGYGGSYCMEAGYAAASMASADRVPTGIDPDVFSPDRFLETAAAR